MSHAFFSDTAGEGQPVTICVAMEKDTALIAELKKIPADCMDATVKGVQMQSIDLSSRDELLAGESKYGAMDEVVLSNGIFIFQKDPAGKLISLYRLNKTEAVDLATLGYTDR